LFEWTIIGGGIQGCTLATYLLKAKRTTTSNLAIIDPHPEPLSTWKRCTNTIEMPYLRSPSIHHLDIDPFSLEKFAKSESGKPYAQFYGPYDRPAITLFNKHCESLFNDIQLENSWIQGRVEQLSRIRQHWQIKLSDGTQFESENVVLAMGLSDHPYWPVWANELRNQGAAVNHIYDDDIYKKAENTEETVIVGGGISAIHTALKLSKIHPGRIKLLTRHPLRIQPFDSDPGWLGPKYMNSFKKVTNFSQRRQMISQARYRGSIPKELNLQTLREERKGRLDIVIDEVTGTSYENGEIKLEIKTKSIVANRILLATGFHATPPGFDWLTSTIESEGLRCASCGYPIVSENSLEWGQNLYVIGALAELVIGPVSRNISGARRGAEKIVQLQPQ
jgi:thioredoxin reductase